jgi:glutamyl endopeptidase
MSTAEALYLHPSQPPTTSAEARDAPVQAGMSVPPTRPAGAGPAAPRLHDATGRDKLHAVPDTLQPPWSLVCHLLVQDATGRIRTGTGWLAGPSTVFTAGRNLWDPARDHVAQRVWVVPGRQGQDAAPFGSWMAPAFDIHPLWRNTQRPDVDLGVVWLPQPLGRRLGCFGFAVHGDAALQGLDLCTSGYPDDRAQGTQWHSRNRLHGLGARMLAFGSDTPAGHAGSPVFAADERGMPVAVGMHIEGNGTENIALRLTRAHFEMLKIWRR